MDASSWAIALLIFGASVALRMQLASWMDKRFGWTAPKEVTVSYSVVFLLAMAAGSLIVMRLSPEITVVTCALFGSMASLSELIAIAAVGFRVARGAKSDA